MIIKDQPSLMTDFKSVKQGTGKRTPLAAVFIDSPYSSLLIVCPLCPVTNQPQLPLGTLGYVIAFLSFCSSSLWTSFVLLSLQNGALNLRGAGRGLVRLCLISPGPSLERSLITDRDELGARAYSLLGWAGPPIRLAGRPNLTASQTPSSLPSSPWKTQSWPWRAPGPVAPPSNWIERDSKAPLCQRPLFLACPNPAPSLEPSSQHYSSCPLSRSHARLLPGKA